MLRAVGGTAVTAAVNLARAQFRQGRSSVLSCILSKAWLLLWWWWRWRWLLLLLLMLSGLGGNGRAAADGDGWWHVASER